MRHLNFILKITLLSYTLIFGQFFVFAQEKTGNESLATEYFKEGDYEKALPLFTELYKNSPDNAMYNYYYGISLLKTHHYETATKEALLNAVVSDTPSNVNFYLGNYFQALNNWSEALDYYDRYKGSEQERRQLQLDKYIDLCRRKVNPFISTDTQTTIFVDTLKKQVQQPDEKNFPIPEPLRKEWFNFQINTQLTYHKIDDFKSEAAKILFTKAWLASMKNDSIVSATELLRKAHEQTNNVTTRLGLVDRIVDAEQQSYLLLRDREKYFEQARVKESAFWEKADAKALSDFAAANLKREKEHDSTLVAKNQAKERAAQQIVKVSEPVKTPENIVKEEPAQVAVSNVQVPVTNDLKIYKIQIGTFYNGKMTTSFKSLYEKLSKLHKIDEYTDDRKITIYTVGEFSNYVDAGTLKNQLRLEGAKGAFIVTFKNGVKVPPVTSTQKTKKKR